MSQQQTFYNAVAPGDVSSVTGTHGVTASPTMGNVVVSGINATTSTVGVASFNPAQFTVTSGAVSITSLVTSVTGSNGVTAVPTSGAVAVAGVNATTSTVGVASFNPSQFSVTSGAVSLLNAPTTIVGTVTTSDGAGQTQVLNANIPTASNTAYSVRVNLVGYDSANGLGIAAEMLGGVKNVAGTVTVIATHIDSTLNGDMPLNSVILNLVVSGTNAQVQVTGVAAHTIDWKGFIEVVSVS